MLFANNLGLDAINLGQLHALSAGRVVFDCGPLQLLGRAIVGCVNLGEKNIAGFVSQFLLVGFSDVNGAICLVSADRAVENGKKLH